jgi:hypothetical protein
MVARPDRHLIVVGAALLAAGAYGVIALGGRDQAVVASADPIRLPATSPALGLPAPLETATPAVVSPSSAIANGGADIWSTPAEFAPPD